MVLSYFCGESGKRWLCHKHWMLSRWKGGVFTMSSYVSVFLIWLKNMRVIRKHRAPGAKMQMDWISSISTVIVHCIILGSHSVRKWWMSGAGNEIRKPMLHALQGLVESVQVLFQTMGYTDFPAFMGKTLYPPFPFRYFLNCPCIRSKNFSTGSFNSGR